MLLTLGAATRQGELATIAAYSVGVSVVAFAATLLGGGTSLAFLTGDLTTQKAVRNVRIRLVLPGVTIGIIILAVVYGFITPLSTVTVILGGATALFNNLSEIEVGFLKRELRTPPIMAADLAVKPLALVFVLGGGSFAVAMVGAAMIRLLLLFIFSRRDPSRIRPFDVSLRTSIARAYDTSLMSMTFLYVYIDRATFLAAPLVMSVTTNGGFAATLSAEQALSAVLVSGLQTSLAVRSQKSGQPAKRWVIKFEVATIAVAILVAALGVIFREQGLQILNLPQTATALTCWVLIWLTLPFGVASRFLQFQSLAAKTHRRALGALLACAIVLTIGMAVALTLRLDWLLPASLLLAEMAATFYGVTLLVRDWRSKGTFDGGLLNDEA
jgi:hypothetical protein